MLKVDLHIHTADDPYDRIPHTVEDLLARAAALRFDVLAITLHDAQFDPAPLAAQARRHGLSLIPGIERTIRGRHVLLINFPASETRAVTEFHHLPGLKARYPNGLVVAPHPFYPLSNCLREWTERHASCFDAVEYNGCYARAIDFNRRTAAWARAHRTPLIGGSDTHRLMAFGSTYTLVDAASAIPDDVCAAIKAGRVELRTAPLPLLRMGEYLARMVLGGHHPVPPDAPVPAAS